ncbi:MAG: aminoacyl-tRNA hydrolase [Sedimentisphaerales bacterium]|jgi:PTH1 family peptidyl-tRNA hydrolase|nr:aminoacyl-tRNA hydrolase [Sedimentisphaerales bacterium]
MAQIKMLVGLGNPGSRYAGTRHNLGFMTIDSLAETLGVKVGRRKFGARFGEVEFAGKKLILLKPWQFMNRSGQAVATAVGFYKLPLRDLLVVTDDMSLEPGRIRLRAKGSAGGHNGLADIIEKLGSGEFARCRLGIGESGSQDAYDYVLDKPSQDQKPLLQEAIDKAKDAVVCWIEFGIERAMNQFNRP